MIIDYSFWTKTDNFWDYHFKHITIQLQIKSCNFFFIKKFPNLTNKRFITSNKTREFSKKNQEFY